ncbi:MAG TPA: C-type lectin domain-containing protein [Polyangiaceae bacterium]|nr:C-type lectin domain-containing protein [Polyangiaceae bacterium]
MGSPVQGSTQLPRALWLCTCFLAASGAGLALASCANVLGIPEEPRLADEAASLGSETPGVTSSDPAANPPADPPLSTPDDSPEQSEPNPLNPPGNSDEQPPGPELTLTDAGPTQQPTDAASLQGECGALQSLGPNGNCFAVLAALQTWADARQSCRDLGTGWDLASIRSAAVDQFITRLISDETWIAASDVAQEGRWVWMDDGTAFWDVSADAGALNGEYAHWNATEPNGGNTTNCARIVPRVGNAWADLPCDSTVAALCEGPAPD